MLEYIAGPIIALLLGMKFTDYRVKEVQKKVEELGKTYEERVVEVNTNTSKALISTLTPVARAIKQLNEQVGIQ